MVSRPYDKNAPDDRRQFKTYRYSYRTCRRALSSRNPQIDEIVKNKPRLLLLNKSDISDSNLNKEWQKYFSDNGIPCMFVSSTTGKSFNNVLDKCREILKEKIESDKARGIVNRTIKMMIVGVPNVGKSSFINKLSGKKSAKTGDRPGVTTGKQWIRLANGFELLDTPGILWPKFEDEQVGLRLAYTGAIRDEVIDTEELACCFLEFLRRKRGFVISGGEIDTLRAASILLDEFRGAKLGNITLENPSRNQEM